MTKKQRDRFLAKVRDLLLSLGATQNGDEFTLQTKAGELWLFPTPNSTRDWASFSPVLPIPKPLTNSLTAIRPAASGIIFSLRKQTVESAIEELEFQLRKVIS